MGGIYGEFLCFFPELFDTYKIYKAEPDVESGYTLTYLRSVDAILQTAGMSIYPLPGGGNNAMLSVKQKYWVWTREELSLADSEFMKINGKYYRGISQSSYSKEGGFWETMIEMVVGNDGTKTETPQLADGEW